MIVVVSIRIAIMVGVSNWPGVMELLTRAGSGQVLALY